MLHVFIDFITHYRETLQGISAFLGILNVAATGTLIIAFRRLHALVRFRREHAERANPRIVVVEAHVLRETEHGIHLDVVSWGAKWALGDLLHDPRLEAQVVNAAVERNGFLRIEGDGQALLMTALEEIVTGNDATANADFIKGRPVDIDRVVICPVTWPGLRTTHIIRVVILDTAWIERVGDPATIERIRATNQRYQYRVREWLPKIAEAWAREAVAPYQTACMRVVEIQSRRSLR